MVTQTNRVNGRRKDKFIVGFGPLVECVNNNDNNTH